MTATQDGSEQLVLAASFVLMTRRMTGFKSTSFWQRQTLFRRTRTSTLELMASGVIEDLVEPPAGQVRAFIGRLPS